MSPLLRQGVHISAEDRTPRLDAYGFEWFHFDAATDDEKDE